MAEKAVVVHSDKKIKVSWRNGIVVSTPSFSIALDPGSASRCDYSFVSHAHIDHVHSPNGKSKVVSSKETAVLAKARGYSLGESIDGATGIELFDSGHIFGSKAILVKDSVFYTGDACARDRGYLKGCRGVKCDTLIMETTYGRPRYVFPEVQKVVDQVNRLIARCFEECRPVILTGYPLGKAQLLSHLFDSWDPVYLHESVYRMNSLHIELGLRLKHLKPISVWSSESEELLKRKPWVMIAPSLSERLMFVRSIAKRHKAAVATFTGWALDSSSRYRTGGNRNEYSFPVSDHCDFRELVNLAKYCDPSRIYTVHGFAEEFAEHLQSLGFEARALAGEDDGQSWISEYT